MKPAEFEALMMLSDTVKACVEAVKACVEAERELRAAREKLKELEIAFRQRQIQKKAAMTAVFHALETE